MQQIRRLMSYPQPMFERLQQLSESTGLALTEIVRRAIDDYLKRLDS